MAKALSVAMRSAVCALLVGTGATASADWPTARHDPRRTGVSTIGSDIRKPAAYWRARLGGALGQVQLHVGDVDGDGGEDVLFITGGALTLARPDGSVSWKTSSLGFIQIIAVADVDLDGQLDVVLSRPTGVAIVDGGTGTVVWDEPAGEVGTPGVFRVADVDGDGAPDLWVDSCGCCAIENGSPGVIYSFAGGFGAPQKLGTPPPRSHCGASSNTVGDFDGDGALDMIVTSDDTATMFGADGVVRAVSGPIPGRAFSALCEAKEVDGQPGDELVCFTNTVYGGAGERGLFVLAYRGSPSPTLQLLWHQVVSAGDGGDARPPASLAVDLDGDGKLEAVVSGKANGAYTTRVFDAATGVELASVDGIALGDVPAHVSGRRWLIVATDSGVDAFSFVGSPPGLNPAWQLPGQRVLRRYDWARGRSAGLTQSLVTPDLDGDGAPELVLGSLSEPAVITAYRTAGGTPAVVGHYALDPGIGIVSVGAPTDAPGLYVSRSDGYVTLLDAALAPSNRQKEGSVTLPGMTVGGYYTGAGSFNSFGRAPIAGRLQPTDPGDALLVVDSRGDLVRIDPEGAANVAPAKFGFRVADTFGASLRPAGSSPAVIGAFRRRHPLTEPPKYSMVSIDAAGIELGGLPLVRPPLYDVLPAGAAGDGATSFVGLTMDGALATDITAMSTAGQQLWQQTLVAVAGTQPLAVGDWDGDGADDVAAVINAPHVYSGTSGAEVATGALAVTYAMPILASVDSDPELEMVLQGAYVPPLALDHDLSPLWVGAAPPQPFPFGALASCPSGLVLVEGTFSVNAMLSRTWASGASAGTTSTQVLASGAAYPDVASAVAAGASPGQLGDVAMSTDLAGDGAGPTALVGSTDGYLYAVGACDGALRWSLAFGVPVGAPILADTDADGKDEILVSAADGYLYALKNEVLPAPAFVWDTDPPHGAVGADVDDIETTGTLYASWAPVPGATSYEVAVVGGGGTYVTSPSWIGVGSSTSATVTNLSLVDGAKYFVGVRAVSLLGRSPDTPSDGVLVHTPTGPDGGVGGTGGSTTASGGTGGQAATGGVGGSVVGTGGGGAEADLSLLSGRACTCSTPGGRGVRGGAEALLLALATACLRRRARPVVSP